MMFSLRIEGRVGRRLHDDPPAGEPLAQVIVGVADQPQRDARGQEGPEALAGRTGEGDVDRAVGQALPPHALDDAIAQDRAHRAVHVADRHVELRRLPPSRWPGPAFSRISQSRWSCERVALRPHAAQRTAVGLVGPAEDGREIQPLGLPVVDGLAAAQPLDAADHVVELAEAELGHDPADFLGHEGQEPHHVLRLAGEPLAQFRVLRGDAHRAGAQVALPHQHAAQR